MSLDFGGTCNIKLYQLSRMLTVEGVVFFMLEGAGWIDFKASAGANVAFCSFNLGIYFNLLMALSWLPAPSEKAPIATTIKSDLGLSCFFLE